jgi:hypothetical protein
MRKVLTMLSAVAVAGALFSICSPPAEARMEYMNALSTKYPAVAEQVKMQKCVVCHHKTDKKQRSEYAKALEKALGKKMVKNVDEINKALDAVAGQEYSDGKKYGDLFKDGKLPAPFSE